MSLDFERHTEGVNPELLIRSDVLYGLAFDVYCQFRDLNVENYWLTPATETQLENQTKLLSLGEPRRGNVYGPISLYVLDGSDEPAETIHAFPYRGGEVIDGDGEPLRDDKEERQRVRQYLLSLRKALVRGAIEPLEKFEMSGQADVDVVVRGGPPTYGGIDLAKRYPKGLGLARIIECAVEEFRGLNGHRPEYGAQITLAGREADEQIPDEVWQPYYNALAGAGSVEADILKKIKSDNER